MHALLQDIRTAVRGLRTAPWFTLAVTATLAIAIRANPPIFIFVTGVLPPHPAPESGAGPRLPRRAPAGPWPRGDRRRRPRLGEHGGDGRAASPQIRVGDRELVLHARGRG